MEDGTDTGEKVRGEAVSSGVGLTVRSPRRQAEGATHAFANREGWVTDKSSMAPLAWRFISSSSGVFSGDTMTAGSQQAGPRPPVRRGADARPSKQWRIFVIRIGVYLYRSKRAFCVVLRLFGVARLASCGALRVARLRASPFAIGAGGPSPPRGPATMDCARRQHSFGCGGLLSRCVGRGGRVVFGKLRGIDRRVQGLQTRTGTSASLATNGGGTANAHTQRFPRRIERKRRQAFPRFIPRDR